MGKSSTPDPHTGRIIRLLPRCAANRRVGGRLPLQCRLLFPASMYFGVGRAARISHFLETGTSR